MNIENIFRLADLIEGDNDFNMQVWDGCIAGLCYRKLLGGKYDPQQSFMYVPDLHVVREYLGIEPDVSYVLFRLKRPDGGEVSPLDNWGISGAQAARVLRNLAILGRVDWDAALKEPADPALPPPPRKLPAPVNFSSGTATYYPAGTTIAMGYSIVQATFA